MNGIRTALVASLALASLFAHAEEYKRLERDGVVIDYPASWEDRAERACRVVQKIASAFGFGVGGDTFALDERRAGTERRLCELLGLEKPGDAMTKSYDAFVAGMHKIESETPDFRKIELWRKSDFIAFAKKGGSISGYKIDAENASVKFIGGVKEIAPMPLVFEDASDAQFEMSVLRKLRPYIDSLCRTYYQMLGTAIERVAANALEEDVLITGAYRRGFVEGYAALCALDALKKVYAELAADRYLEFLTDIDKKALSPRIDPLTWLSNEYCVRPQANEPTNDDRARQLLWMFAIRKCMDRHGEDIVARVLIEMDRKAIEASKRLEENKQNIENLYVKDARAVVETLRELTGEDIRSLLKPKRRAKKTNVP